MTRSFLVTLLLRSWMELRVLIFLKNRKSIIPIFVSLKYRKSITSINHIYGHLSIKYKCPYFNHGLYTFASKNNLCESSPKPRWQSVPWLCNIIIQNLSWVDFHIWRIRKQLDQMCGRRTLSNCLYAMPMGRTCDSVKPPLGNSVDLLQAWFIKFCLHLDRYKGNTLYMWTSFLQHQLKSCVATNRTAFNNYEVLVHTWWGVVLTTWLKELTAFSLWIHCVLGAWGVRTFHIQWMVKILHFPP